MNSREEALSIVNTALAPLKKIDELYNTALNLSQQAEATATHSSAKASKGKVVSIIAGLLVYFGLNRLFNSIFPNVRIIIFAVIDAILGIIVFLFVKKIFSGFGSNSQKTIAKKNEAIDRISTEIEQTAVENADIINSMPRDYRYYDAAVFIESALENGRAESMKEAINLYENHLHQMRMENYNRQILFANEQQCKMLTAIEDNTNSIDRTTSTMLGFNVWQFLSR